MKLVAGEGAPGEGACWMSAVNYYSSNGEAAWSDHPECVDPVIRTLCVAVNDEIETDEAREEIIGPRLFSPVGTNKGLEMSQRRARWVALQVADLWDAPEWVREWLRSGELERASRVYRFVTDRVWDFSWGSPRSAAWAVEYAANATPAPTSTASLAWAAIIRHLPAGSAIREAVRWIDELCSWTTQAELDPERARKTLKEACLA